MTLNIYYSVYPNSTQPKYFTIFKPKLPTIYENNNIFTKYKQKIFSKTFSTSLETIHEVNENYSYENYSYVKISYV